MSKSTTLAGSVSLSVQTKTRPARVTGAAAALARRKHAGVRARKLAKIRKERAAAKARAAASKKKKQR
jgi:hypothetical protein